MDLANYLKSWNIIEKMESWTIKKIPCTNQKLWNLSIDTKDPNF